MKTSITNVSTNSASPVPIPSHPIQFNSPNNFSQLNSFPENTIQNQYNNNPSVGIEFLAPPDIITTVNNPNLNILYNPAASNSNFIPINGSPMNIQYAIAPQLNRPLNPPVPPPNISYNNLNGAKMSRSKFTPQEDATLKELVAKYGSTKWSEIAMKLPNRTGRQCRERWKNYLAPGIQNGPWSPEEDALLVQKVKELGTMWSKMVPFFPGRTDVNLKNRWVTLRYKKGNNINDDEVKNNTNSISHKDNNENDDDKNEDEVEENTNLPLLNNIDSNSNNSIQVYPNFVNYNQYYNYPNYQVNPPNYNNSFYNNQNQVEYRQSVLQISAGDSLTIRQTNKLNRNMLIGSYTDIGTETEHNESGYNNRNNYNSPNNYRNSNRSKLEPSIILSQPRWLLNHKSSDASLNNDNSRDEQNDVKKKKDLNEPSQIKLNPSSFQQSPRPHDRLEVPLLVAMPLGTSS